MAVHHMKCIEGKKATQGQSGILCEGATQGQKGILCDNDGQSQGKGVVDEVWTPSVYDHYADFNSYIYFYAKHNDVLPKNSAGYIQVGIPSRIANWKKTFEHGPSRSLFVKTTIQGLRSFIGYY